MVLIIDFDSSNNDVNDDDHDVSDVDDDSYDDNDVDNHDSDCLKMMLKLLFKCIVMIIVYMPLR